MGRRASSVAIVAWLSGCAASPAPSAMNGPPCSERPLAAAAPPPAAAAAPAAAASSKEAEQALLLVRRLHGEPRDASYSSFSARLRQTVSEAKLLEVAADVERKLGKLVDMRVLDEERKNLYTTVYLAAFFARGTRRYEVSVGPDGVIEGLFVKPFADDTALGPGPADDYVTKRLYGLPLRGEWSVSQGGRDPASNQHVGNAQQWYAFDLTRLGPDGKKTRGDGSKNEDYWAWNESVIAPADGTVTLVVDGLPDHGLDHRDRYFLTGNVIVIDHGGDEYSVLAHLRQDSILVRRGQRVKRGQELARIGNSGNSTGPHLHFHLAAGKDVSRAHGLPIRFGPLEVNGTRVEQAEPKQGDRVRNLAPDAPARRK